MPFTDPKTWEYGELVTAELLNEQLRDNMLALKNPPTGQVVRDNGGFYSTTSTSFVAVDSTNVKVTLTTSGGDVMVGFVGTAHADATSSRFMSFDVDVDGNGGWASSQGYASGIATTSIQSTTAWGVSFGPILIQSLAPGTHTFTLLWRVSAGTGYLHSDTSDASPQNEQPLIFWAREVS